MIAGLHDEPPGPGTVLWADIDHEHDMMSTRMLGFWLYMLSDSLIFAALFAAYAVLSYPTSFMGGPTPRDVASPLYGYAETVVLFSSVFAYGMVMVKLKQDLPRASIGRSAAASCRSSGSWWWRTASTCCSACCGCW